MGRPLTALRVSRPWRTSPLSNSTWTVVPGKSRLVISDLRTVNPPTTKITFEINPQGDGYSLEQVGPIGEIGILNKSREMTASKPKMIFRDLMAQLNHEIEEKGNYFTVPL